MVKYALVFEDETIFLTADKGEIVKKNGYVGKEVIMGIRPEDLDDDAEFIAKHQDAVIDAKVEVTEFMGAETYFYLKKGKANITVRVAGTSKAKVGDTIKIAMDASKIHVFDKETELTVI